MLSAPSAPSSRATGPSSKGAPPSLLSAKQARELQRAVLDYLATPFPRTHACLVEEGGEEGATSPGPGDGEAGGAGGAVRGLLEQKWTSVVRLQKRILQLEAEVDQLRTALQSASLSSRTPVTSQPGWHPTTCKYTLGGTGVSAGKAITALALQPPAQAVLAAGGEDCFVRLWDLEGGECLQTLKDHAKPVCALAWRGGDGRVLASGSADTTIRLYEATEAGGRVTPMRTLFGHEHTISALAFLPGAASVSGSSSAAPPTAASDLLASASRDRTVRIWRVASGTCVATLTGHTEWVRCLAVEAGPGMPRGVGVAVSSSKPSTSTGAITAAEGAEEVYTLATGSQDKSIRLWRATLSREASQEPGAEGRLAVAHLGDLLGHQHVVEAVTFAPPSALCAYQAVLKLEAKARPVPLLFSCGRDNTIRAWDVATRSCVAVWEGHANWVRDLTFSPSGHLLLSVSDDRSIRAWSLDGVNVHTLPAAHARFVACVQCHGSAGILVTGGVEGSVKVWTGESA